MAYETYLPDTTQRNKILGMANQFAPSDQEIQNYLAMIRAQGAASLHNTFGAAQADIGAQFTPAMRMAQARLGANPLLGDSGYANRLNRQLQQAAFTDLSNRYGEAAAQQSQSEGSALQNLINQRLAARTGFINAAYGGAQKKKKSPLLGQLGGVAGSLIGTLVAPGAGTAIGGQLGSSLGGYQASDAYYG